MPLGRGRPPREPRRLRHLYRAARKHRAVSGRWPRVISPVTHTDHLFWYKTCFRDPRMPQRQDKVLVKDFVARTVGPEWVIPTLWDGVRLPHRDRRTWPRPFVIKANHGCGFNTFVRGRARWTRRWWRRWNRCRGRKGPRCPPGEIARRGARSGSNELVTRVSDSCEHCVALNSGHPPDPVPDRSGKMPER